MTASSSPRKDIAMSWVFVGDSAYRSDDNKGTWTVTVHATYDGYGKYVLGLNGRTVKWVANRRITSLSGATYAADKFIGSLS